MAGKASDRVFVVHAEHGHPTPLHLAHESGRQIRRHIVSDEDVDVLAEHVLAVSPGEASDHQCVPGSES